MWEVHPADHRSGNSTANQSQPDYTVDGLKHFIPPSILSRPFSLWPRHRRIVMEKVLIALAAALGIALGTIPYLSFSPAQGQASIEWADDAPDVVHGIPDDPMDFFR